MEKLTRFLIVAAMFIATMMVFYSILPAIVWTFGGSFQAVAQSPAYVVIFLFTAIPLQGFLFSECFDSEFYEKKRKR